MPNIEYTREYFCHQAQEIKLLLVNPWRDKRSDGKLSMQSEALFCDDMSTAVFDKREELIESINAELAKSSLKIIGGNLVLASLGLTRVPHNVRLFIQDNITDIRNINLSNNSLDDLLIPDEFLKVINSIDISTNYFRAEVLETLNNVAGNIISNDQKAIESALISESSNAEFCPSHGRTIRVTATIPGGINPITHKATAQKGFCNIM